MLLKRTSLLSLLWLVMFNFSEGQNQSSIQAEKSTFSPFDIFEYRCVGPTRGGRVTAVAGTPSNPHLFYMGATGGGVWKTEDSGIIWENISDGFFESPSIGAIRVSPSNPDIIYVGTGSDGLRSNIITGKGVYKSNDGGKNWKNIGLELTGHIGAVEIHPKNPDIAFVAAIGQAFNPNSERGVYRTKDGGESWDQVLFISDTIGISDLEFCPTNPKIIYAGAWRAERKPWTIISGGNEGGIYKSSDGGDTWEKLESGLPDGLIGKIDLAVSPAAPSRLYALIEAPAGKGGVYLSHDQGKTFELVSTKEELLDRPFYYCNIDADPKNADMVYVNSTQFWKSTDSGKSWTRLRTPHGDNHDMWINPHNSSVFIQGNDGGANITSNGGQSWSSQINQPTAELYQIEVDDQYPYWLYAGQQDNSTIMVPSQPPYSPVGEVTSFWQAVGGCETGPAVPKPGNHNIVYSNCKGRFGVYDKRTGQEKQYYVGATNIYSHNPKNLKFRFQRVAPIHVSPHNPDVVYHTSQYVHKTEDEGKTWEIISPDLTAFTQETQVISGSPITRDITGEEYYSTIYAIRESSLMEGQIWVGANDGPVHVTQNGGKVWKNVTPENLLPGGRVDCVEPSPHNPSKAYISVLRYQLGDWKPYIYRTTNTGDSWRLLTNGENGIPVGFPVRVVREDPEREGLLYSGTEFGLYISFDDGQNWISFQQNLPTTPITDIKIFRDDLVVSTMGRSFWIMDDLSSLRDPYFNEVVFAASQVDNMGEISPLKISETYLFKPRDMFRSRSFGGRSSDDAVPSYPSAAVHLDYYLANDIDEIIRLEITHELGNVVRSFYNNVPARDSTVSIEVDMATGFSVQGETSSLKSEKGIHRFRWDMRHEGPWDKSESRSGRNGPLVIPGKYVARLSVGQSTTQQEFEIMMDPRVAGTSVLSQEDLAKQERLSLQIRDLISSAKRLSEQIEVNLDTIQSRLKSDESNGDMKSLQVHLKNFKYRLETQDGRYMKNMLISQLNYLYSMLNRADQIPGNDAFLRFEELKEEFATLELEFKQFDREKINDMLEDD